MQYEILFKQIDKQTNKNQNCIFQTQQLNKTELKRLVYPTHQRQRSMSQSESRAKCD